jgi:dTDP-glucose pyrophosphorylase
MQFDTIILSDKHTISDAIKLFSKENRLILVVDKEKKLIGVINDGDLRRGLMRGYNEKDDLFKIINTNPVVGTPDLNQNSAEKLMKVNKVEFLPIVDNQGNVVNIYFIKPNNNIIQNKFVIMAGGRGTRLLPLTENCPKPMLQVAGKPILEHIILKAKHEGFRNFCISVNYLSNMIENYFGDGANFEVNIEYLHESEPLGTAGSIGQLRETTDLPLLITNGDIFSDIGFLNVLDFHIKKNSFATMVVTPKERTEEFGVVEISKETIVGFQEKPVIRHYINSGVYCIDASILEYFEANTYCDMPSLFQKAILNKENVLPYIAHEQWLDIGRPSDFQMALDKYENLLNQQV